MGQEPTQHVFVSYVREDSSSVDALCKILEASQIPYWRDRSSLAPGDAWKAKIREAIREGSLVFLACFSENSRARDKSYMNEELNLAIEEFRKLPPGRTWIIPVRLDDGDIPDWELSSGRMLSDLNAVNLFGAEYTPQAAALVTTLGRIMGGPHASPATTLAAVEGARDADRALLLRRLTKELLPDPARRIELDDLISHEVRRILTAMSAPDQFPTGPLKGDDLARTTVLVETANRYWKLVEPFCFSLQIASRWASTDQLEPWIAGLRSIVTAATKMQGGVVSLIQVRHIAALPAVMTAALSSMASGRWDNFRVLLAEPTVQDRYGSGTEVALLEATSPWEPFRDSELAANALSRTASTGEKAEVATAHFIERKSGKYYTPVSDWMHTVLRPIFEEQFAEEDRYSTEFDRAEVALGLVSQDLATQQYGANPNTQWLAKSRWFGRATWQSRRTHQSPLPSFRAELDRTISLWPPLQGGLFGSDVEQALAALVTYEVNFRDIVSSQH